MPRSITRRHIGDGVYVYVTKGQVTLQTWDGKAVTNQVVMEPEVWAALTDYVAFAAARSGLATVTDL